MENAFFIYILYSPSADKYYVGHTHDVKARVQDHNHAERPAQSSKYTFKHRPWELKCFFEAGEDRGTAIKIERYIKRQKSRKFIEKVIEVHLDPEKLAQLIRVPARRD